MPSTITAKDRFVRVDPSRGYGNDDHIVEVFNERECKIRNTVTGSRFTIYTAHLYTTFELRRKSFADTRAAAERIGVPKLRPGKHK